MADGLQLRVNVRGAREVERAAAALPAHARAELRQGLGRVAGRLTQAIRAAGRSESRQAARAAATVRSQVRGAGVTVSAGPHPLLFGSEFGATRRFGWYAFRRYADSPARQFRPHYGAGSYWFFSTLERERPRVDAEVRAIGDNVVRRWSA